MGQELAGLYGQVDRDPDDRTPGPFSITSYLQYVNINTTV
jgi:hypothetical protein